MSSETSKISKIQKVRKTIEEKVRGKITAEHSVFGHYYRFPSGVLVSSVTQRNVLDKPHLVPWAVEQGVLWLEQGDRWEKLKGKERKDYMTGAKFAHRDIRDDAGTVGGKAHAIIETWINKWIETGKKPGDIRELIPVSEDYRVFGACRSAEASFLKYNVVPVVSEILVGDEKFGGAGTLDLIVMNEKGELELWDWKSSNSMTDFYACQVSAYKHFFERMTGLKIKHCRIFKIDKFSDKFSCYLIPNTKEALKAFKHLSKVYDWLNNKEEKVVADKIIVKI